MKKLILLLFTGCLIGFSSSAQLTEHAIGLRLGGEDGVGAEISYQRALGSNNRLELDLGFASRGYYDAFKLTGLYQWVRPIEGGLSWFYGFGAGIGYADWDFRDPYYRDRPFDPDDDGRIFASIDGVVGLEYSFINLGAPIQLALDLNPEIEFFGDRYYDDDFDFDLELGFAIRYQF